MAIEEELREAFDAAFPRSEDVAGEVEALEKLYGVPMPPDVDRFLELDRHPNLHPTPTELAQVERPFEALILRAQELDDCVSVLFPLTGSIYLRRFMGAEVLGHVLGHPDRPVMPFIGWRQDKWAHDLPTFLRLAEALKAFNGGNDAEVERLLGPIWGRIQRTEYTDEMFYTLEDTGAAQRLEHAWGDKPKAKLAQWWRHERALFFGFAFLGKFRPPEEGAFSNDPRKGLEHEHLLKNVGLQMSLLWRGWFLPDGDLLDRAMAATEASPSTLVQDARRLITEMLDGRTMVGTADLARARERYKTWVDDPAAYQHAVRAKRRETLEERCTSGEYGIELTRAQWPLDATAHTETPTHTWDPQTLSLQIDGGDSRQLTKPDPDARISLGTYQPKTAVSPSRRRFACQGSVHRAKRDKTGWENAPVLVEYDLDAGSWRILCEAKDLRWCAYLEDDRCLIRDDQAVTLVRDLGSEISTRHSVFVGQPHTLFDADLGLVVAYGSPDLVNGRNPDDAKAPFVRVLGVWRDDLACVAAFPVDGIELARDGAKLGLVSLGREVAWELRGLTDGVERWRAQSQATEAEARAKREAFGEVTIDRAVEALNTFLGTAFGSEYQEGVDAAFATALATLTDDEDARAAAQRAESPLHFAETIKGPFATAMSQSDRGPQFLDFALKCTILVPAYADIVVRAAATSAWKALRDQSC